MIQQWWYLSRIAWLEIYDGHAAWKPLAFAVMPLALCAIYGHEWPDLFPFGAAVPLRYFSINMPEVIVK